MDTVSDDFRTRAALERVGATHGLDEAQTGALAAYVGLLLGWRRANVTGLTDPVAVVDTLIGDSLALLAVPQLQEREQGVWLDLGAGAGIPGIPLAVASPEVRITLLDAVAKKCAFLEEAVRGERAHRPGSGRVRAQRALRRRGLARARGARRGARPGRRRAGRAGGAGRSAARAWTASCWRARRGRRSRRSARRRRRPAGAAA